MPDPDAPCPRAASEPCAGRRGLGAPPVRARHRLPRLALALAALLPAGQAAAQSTRSGVTRSHCAAMGGTQFTPMSSLGVQPELGTCYIPPRGGGVPSAPSMGGGNPGVAAAGIFLGTAMGMMQLEAERQRRAAEARRQEEEAQAARRAAEQRAAEQRAAEERRQREAADAARRMATPNPFAGASVGPTAGNPFAGGAPGAGAPAGGATRVAAPGSAAPLRRTSVPPVTAGNFCAQVSALAQRNAALARDGDPAHRAAAQNYANAHAAFCQRDGGSAPPAGATALGAALTEPIGLLAGLADPLRRLALSEAQRRAEEARLERLLADADAELARARRACPASDSPFTAPAQGCAAPAPAPVEQHPRYDSVRRKLCTRIVFEGPEACVPDETRRAMRRLLEGVREQQERGNIVFSEAAARAARGSGGHAPHVLRPEDFRRIAAGARFEDVYEGGMEDRALADIARRVNEARAAARRH
ncbi:MAG: hypothetical protein N3D18_14305 [Roseococcus sp.]|nr:hypothetical protein [Roseococcus sp.]